MNLSYAICACNESRELSDLLEFLDTTRDKKTSEIVILIDSSNTTKNVTNVLKAHADKTRVYTRDFNNDFAEHKNFLNSKCNGTWIFNIDADEIPREILVKEVEKFTSNTHPSVDAVVIPRINICPGYTKDFIKSHKFTINDLGWINWPDYQVRIFKNGFKWEGKVHEKLNLEKVAAFSKEPNPLYSLWHVKSVGRQNKQNLLYDTITELSDKPVSA